MQCFGLSGPGLGVQDRPRVRGLGFRVCLKRISLSLQRVFSGGQKPYPYHVVVYLKWGDLVFVHSWSFGVEALCVRLAGPL